jgi:hypothetical protein
MASVGMRSSVRQRHYFGECPFTPPDWRGTKKMGRLDRGQ